MPKLQLMIRLLSLFLLLAMIKTPAFAQYYYKDIISIRQLLADRQTYKDQKIRTIEVHSFESDDQPSKGFFCEKKISKDYGQIDTYTRSYLTDKSLLSSYFNNKGYLIRSEDSSETNISVSNYVYDDNEGNLLNIATSSRSSDDDFVTTSTETHQYIYDIKGQLQKMFRIKNQKDSTEIDFTLDEKGNVSEEIEVAVDGGHFYYYYDNKNRLTDVVRYNFVKEKQLPDFIFEYNEEGQLSQMVISHEGISSSYTVWKYVYDDGLRIKEKCYSKDNELLGYFEYEYKDK
jgi:hypothetical protein